MKYINILLTSVLCTCPIALTAAPRPLMRKEKPLAGPSIRVLLEKNVQSALLEAKGEYVVVNKSTGEILSSGPIGKRFVIHAVPDGLRWGEEYPEAFQISIMSKTPATSFFVNGIQYKGEIAVYHCKDHLITVVNEVSIEDFVKSTLCMQIEEPLEKEALAALAIAARTEAFGRIKASKHVKYPWDVTSEEVNYLGSSVQAQKEFITESVDWTKFMVLESIKDGGHIQPMHLSLEKAQSLADKGMDAKKILLSTYPHSKLNLTQDPKTIR